MKKFKLLALALAIGTTSLFAANKPADIPAKEIRTQVVDLFKTPNFNVEKDYDLNIVFTFNSEGEIVIQSVYAKDKSKIDKNVLNYIHKTMDHKIIQTPGEFNRAFTLPLKIKQESL
ncbi:MAG TPA: hypothetical protein VIN72_01905 [Lutibacter sp.]